MQGKMFGDCISPHQKSCQQGKKKKAGEDAKKTFSIAGMDGNGGRHCGNCGDASKGLKTDLLCTSPLTLLGVCPKDSKSTHHIDNHSSRSIASFFTMARALNEPTLKRYIKCMYIFRSRFYVWRKTWNTCPPSPIALSCPPPTLQSISLRQGVFLILSCLASAFDRKLVIFVSLSLAYFA